MKSRAAFKSVKPGFTLFELLIVFAITGVVVAFLTPVTIRFYQNQLVDDTARTLVDTLRRAHDQAVARKDDTPHGVKVVTASSTFVHFEGASFATRNATMDEIIDYPSSIVFTSTSTEVVFSELYGTSTLSDWWNVAIDGSSQQVRINSQGTIDPQ